LKAFGLRSEPPFAVAFAILALATATIAAAWIFQFFGYAPCELCLTERFPYYAGIALAALAVVLARRGSGAALRSCFSALFLIFAASAALGAYHAGVEWHFWPGPTDCTGSFQKAQSMQDFVKQLHHVKVVRCDEVALRVMGLSLAVWNMCISTGLAALAILGLRAG
jgi:disulfide bond formation protein DsbB